MGCASPLLCIVLKQKPVERQAHSPHETLASLGKARPPSQVIPSFHSCTTVRCRFVVHSLTSISRDSITHWSGARMYTLPRTNTASTCRGTGGNWPYTLGQPYRMHTCCVNPNQDVAFTSWNLKLHVARVSVPVMVQHTHSRPCTTVQQYSNPSTRLPKRCCCCKLSQSLSFASHDHGVFHPCRPLSPLSPPPVNFAPQTDSREC